MFRIKVCGVTRAVDALTAVSAGADAIGLNFFDRSSRFVTPDDAAEVVRRLGETAVRVGVFVNSPPHRVVTLWQQLSLDYVQLHGDEPSDYVGQLPPEINIIRAYRWGQHDARSIEQDLQACRLAQRLPAAVLIDAQAPGAYGGTGQVVDWQDLSGERPWLLGRPLVLAGGLSPTNVAEAIGIVAPSAVDTASGVEQKPGHKDEELLRQFARRAERALGTNHNARHES